MLIAPQMGAGFCQYLAHLTKDSRGGSAAPGVERFVYVLEGQISIHHAMSERELDAGEYVWIPPDFEHEIAVIEPGEVLVIEKKYQRRRGRQTPKMFIGNESEIEAKAYRGDLDANIKTLLPVDSPFDMAVNISTFMPGANMSLAEVHMMEHGMLMLDGHGICRMDEHWYPVQSGDAMWVGPYCAHWFAALGKTPASYIYFKDVNRDPMTA